MYTIEEIRKLIGENPQQVRRSSFEQDKIHIEDLLLLFTEYGKMLEPDFTVDDDNRFVYENLLYWLMNDKRMRAFSLDGEIVPGDVTKGIYLGGTIGSGKTLATEILQRMSTILGIKASVNGDTPRNFAFTNIRTDDVVRSFIRNGEVDDLMKKPFVCFQDLGTEPLEAVYMGNRTNVMRQVMEYRGDRRDQYTIFTSNILPDSRELETKYGARAVSRVNSMCNLLVLGGSDRRR